MYWAKPAPDPPLEGAAEEAAEEAPEAAEDAPEAAALVALATAPWELEELEDEELVAEEEAALLEAAELDPEEAAVLEAAELVFTYVSKGESILRLNEHSRRGASARDGERYTLLQALLLGELGGSLTTDVGAELSMLPWP